MNVPTPIELIRANAPAAAPDGSNDHDVLSYWSERSARRWMETNNRDSFAPFDYYLGGQEPLQVAFGNLLRNGLKWDECRTSPAGIALASGFECAMKWALTWSGASLIRPDDAEGLKPKLICAGILDVFELLLDLAPDKAISWATDAIKGALSGLDVTGGRPLPLFLSNRLDGRYTEHGALINFRSHVLSWANHNQFVRAEIERASPVLFANAMVVLPVEGYAQAVLGRLVEMDEQKDYAQFEQTEREYVASASIHQLGSGFEKLSASQQDKLVRRIRTRDALAVADDLYGWDEAISSIDADRVSHWGGNPFLVALLNLRTSAREQDPLPDWEREKAA